MSSPLDRPVDFERTLRSLAAETWRGNLVLGVCSALLLLACGVWTMAAEVPVYVATQQARLQGGRDALVVAAPVAGMVSEVRAEPGLRVAAGALLYRLTAAVEERQASEERRRAEGLRRQREAAVRERASVAARLGQLEELTASRSSEVQARARAAKAAAAQAERAAARAERLFAEELATSAELEALRAEAALRRAEAEAGDGAVARIEAEGDAVRQELRAALAAVDRELARLTGELEAAVEAAAGRAAAVERHVVRAPFDGRVYEVAVRRPGTVVLAGDPLATLVPDAEIAAVAYFAPAEALGRIAPGQRAELRLPAFPWREHGSLAARVVAVEEVTHEQRVRVDLALLPDRRFAGRRAHGLPATALVEVERRSPLRLLVRGLRSGWETPTAAHRAR